MPIIKSTAADFLMKINDGDYLLKIIGKASSNAPQYTYLIKRFEEEGLVKKEIVGTKKLIYLTEKGTKIKNHLLKINEVLPNVP